MTVELQKAPGLGKIGFDSSYNELDFQLEKNGLISSKKSNTQVAVAKSTKKETLDKSQPMASRYSDEYDSYDEDFESPSPERNNSRTRTNRRHSFTKDNSRSLTNQYTPTPPQNRRKKNVSRPRKDSYVSYRSAYGVSRVPAKTTHRKMKKSHSADPRPAEATSMVHRVLSANRKKVTKLYNIVDELQQEVDSLKQENRTLKRIHVKQERELKRVEKDEVSLPQLLQRHSAELRTIRERLKRNKEDLTKKERESQSHDAEILKLRDMLQHYKSLANNKKLEERASLAQRLEKVEQEITNKDKRITELQRTIGMTDKARQRELKEHRDRYKHAKEELKRVQQDFRALREKLQEKEKQLELTNVYHQQIARGRKKGDQLALPAALAPISSRDDEKESILSKTERKRNNVFITNAQSDSGSVATEIEAAQRDSDDKSSVKESIGKQRGRNVKSEFSGSGSLELERQREEAKRKEEFERQERRRREEQEEREEELGRRRQEEKERRKEEESKKREEEVRKRAEEEGLRKMRLIEEDRTRKEKEEAERKRFEEEDEVRRKKDLLLARMKAIDSSHNPKPNGIVETGLDLFSKESKPKKLPIFLQSSTDTPKASTEVPKRKGDGDLLFESGRRKSTSSSSARSKYSTSYDFKETVENLHHGLPAHPSDQHLRLAGGKTVKDTHNEDVSFGSYKSSVGRPAKTETFGSYNPSFAGDPKKDAGRKNSGLDFGRGETKTDTSTSTGTPKEQKDDLTFGSYQPTIGASASNDTGNTKRDEVDDMFGVSARKPIQGRRARGDANLKGSSTFGDGIFGDSKPKKDTSIFDDDPFSSSGKPKESNGKEYPWENKVNMPKKSLVSKDNETLLPRRQKIHQGFGQGPQTNVRAVSNALNDTIEDDIEEVIL